LVDADLADADLTKQQDLVITDVAEREVTTDDLEVAQFLYLLLHNEKLQRVIDTITSKVVLILGCFSLSERKQVLDSLRDELRKRDYVPVVFDFEKLRSQTTTSGSGANGRIWPRYDVGRAAGGWAWASWLWCK
jgi:hypothetical protein